MAIYRYVKATAENKKLFRPNFIKVTPYVFIVFGFVLLATVFYPLFSFGSKYGNSAKLVSPLVGEQVLGESNTDLTKASNWFPGYPQKHIYPPEKPLEYEVSIPKLKIEKAKAIIGSDDLSKSLIHYGGTALPGEKGNAVIFGHSASPMFYNPKNYFTIFTMLEKLEDGDKIVVVYDKVTYTYVVYGRVTVEPTDFSVLYPDSDFYTMSLITCIPPGFDVQRLVVKARLSFGGGT